MSQIRSFEGLVPAIDPRAWLDPSCLVIGDVEIGALTSLWPGVVARGDVNRICIGCETNIQDGSVLHTSRDGPFMPGGAALSVGDRTTIGHKVILHGCDIGNDCLVGMGAIIMDKAIVEPGVMIGAGSLVTPGKVLRTGFLYTGSPVRQTRTLTDHEKDSIAYSARHYVELAQRHRNALG